MNKQQRTQSERKMYRPLTSLIKAILLLSLVFGINSCKKDIITPASKLSRTTNGFKIKVIPYFQFLNSVELNSTGSLKLVLQSAVNNSNQTKVSSVSSTTSYEIETTNVKELIIKDTTSYVLALKPQTAHATHFQNITIQTAKGKTIAFLTTYTPTKEWIKEWKSGKHIDTAFRGGIYVNRINLSDVVTNTSKTTGISVNAANPSNSINIGGNTIKLLPGQCETYSVYETVMMPCGYEENPHYSRADCTYFAHYGTWELIPGVNDWPPYEAVRYVGEAMYCEPAENPPPGNTGGGNTTPNPPGGYNPCDSVPPIQYRIKNRNGVGMLTVPPTPCDENTGGDQPYQLTAADYALLNELAEEDAIADSIANNQPDCYGTGRTGNVRWPGTAEHWLIQFDYTLNNSGSLKEYSIPNAGPSGTSRGYADLVNMNTGEIFEIKPPSGVLAGSNEVQNYVTKANLSCSTTSDVPFSKGTSYVAKYFMHPYLPGKALKAELNTAGVIVYTTVEPQNAPQVVPVPLPQALADKLKNFVNSLLQNSSNMEQQILVFLKRNPQIVPYLKAAAAAIVIGTIIEDVLTGGAGIADDWVSFVAARNIYRIASRL